MKVESLSVRKKFYVEFYSDLSRSSTGFKSKTAHFYLQPLFNALNMLSALRLIDIFNLLCWALSD